MGRVTSIVSISSTSEYAVALVALRLDVGTVDADATYPDPLPAAEPRDAGASYSEIEGPRSETASSWSAPGSDGSKGAIFGAACTGASGGTVPSERGYG